MRSLKPGRWPQEMDLRQLGYYVNSLPARFRDPLAMHQISGLEAYIKLTSTSRFELTRSAVKMLFPQGRSYDQVYPGA